MNKHLEVEYPVGNLFELSIHKKSKGDIAISVLDSYVSLKVSLHQIMGFFLKIFIYLQNLYIFRKIYEERCSFAKNS